MGDESTDENILKKLERITSSKDSDVGFNKQILDYYKRFGHLRDVQQYFLLDTLENKLGESSQSIKDNLKWSTERGAQMEGKHFCDACTSTEHRTQHCPSFGQPQTYHCITARQESEELGNETDKSLEVFGDANSNMSLNKQSSPANSIKRLEWDSLGDVGYANDQKTTTADLSTLEKLALQGQFSNRENLMDTHIGLPIAESSPFDSDVVKKKVQNAKKLGKKSSMKKLAQNREKSPVDLKITREICFDFDLVGRKKVKSKEPKQTTVEKKTTKSNEKSDLLASSKSSASFSNEKSKLPIKLLPKYNTKKGQKDKRIRRSKSSSSQKSSNAISEKSSRQSGTRVSRADSFEYMPGDVYTESKASLQSDEMFPKTSRTDFLSRESSTSSRKSDISFTRDLAKNIAMLKRIIERRYKDAEIRKRLIKKVVAKLVERKYKSDDSVSDFLSELTFESQKIGLERKLISSLPGTSSSVSNSSKILDSSSSTNKSNVISTKSDIHVNDPKTMVDKSKSLEDVKEERFENTSRTTSDELFAQYLRALKREKELKKLETKARDSPLESPKIKIPSLSHKQKPVVKTPQFENDIYNTAEPIPDNNSEISLPAHQQYSKRLKVTPASLALEKKYFRQEEPKNDPIMIDAETARSLADCKSAGGSSLLKSRVSILTSSPQLMATGSEINPFEHELAQNNKIYSEKVDKKREEKSNVNSGKNLPSCNIIGSNTYPPSKGSRSKANIHLLGTSKQVIDSEGIPKIEALDRKNLPIDRTFDKMTDFFSDLKMNKREVIAYIVGDDTEMRTEKFNIMQTEYEPEKATQTQVTINPKKLQATLGDINLYDIKGVLESAQILKTSNVELNKGLSSSGDTDNKSDNIAIESAELIQRPNSDKMREDIKRCIGENQSVNKSELEKCNTRSYIDGSHGNSGKESRSSLEDEAQKDIIIELIKQIARRYKRDKLLHLDKRSSTSEKYVKLILDSMQYLLGTDSDCELCIIDNENKKNGVDQMEKSNDAKEKYDKNSSADVNKIENLYRDSTQDLLETSFSSHKGRLSQGTSHRSQKNANCGEKTVSTQSNESSTFKKNVINRESDPSSLYGMPKNRAEEISVSPKSDLKSSERRLLERLENTYIRPEIVCRNEMLIVQVQHKSNTNDVGIQGKLTNPEILQRTRTSEERNSSAKKSLGESKSRSHDRYPDKEIGSSKNSMTRDQDSTKEDTSGNNYQPHHYFSRGSKNQTNYDHYQSNDKVQSSEASDSSCDRSDSELSEEKFSPKDCPYYQEYVSNITPRFHGVPKPIPEQVCQFGVCPYWEQFHRERNSKRTCSPKASNIPNIVIKSVYNDGYNGDYYGRPAVVSVPDPISEKAKHRQRQRSESDRKKGSPKKIIPTTDREVFSPSSYRFDTQYDVPLERPREVENSQNMHSKTMCHHCSKNVQDLKYVKKKRSNMGINTSVQTNNTQHIPEKSKIGKRTAIQTEYNEDMMKNQRMCDVMHTYKYLDAKPRNINDKCKKVAFTREKYVGLAFCKCPRAYDEYDESISSSKCNNSNDSSETSFKRDNVCQTAPEVFHNITKQKVSASRHPHTKNIHGEWRRCRMNQMLPRQELPKPVAYNLILEPSDSFTLKEEKKKKALKEVVVKVPSITVPPHSLTDYNYNFKAFPSPGPSNDDISSNQGNDNSIPAVRDYLEMNRPDFFQNVKQREEYMKKSRRLRLLRDSAKRQIFDLLSQHGITEVDSDEIRMLARNMNIQIPSRYFMERRKVITEEEMKRHSNKIYQTLPEMQEKKKEKIKEAQRTTNLIMAGLYRKMLQRKTLKGETNIPHSRSIVKI